MIRLEDFFRTITGRTKVMVYIPGGQELFDGPVTAREFQDWWEYALPEDRYDDIRRMHYSNIEKCLELDIE